MTAADVSRGLAGDRSAGDSVEDSSLGRELRRLTVLQRRAAMDRRRRRRRRPLRQLTV